MIAGPWNDGVRPMPTTQVLAAALTFLDRLYGRAGMITATTAVTRRAVVGRLGAKR